MSRDPWLYLEDVEASCRKVMKYVEGYSFEEFLRDDKTFDAVIRNLEVIGEAVKHVPQDLTAGHPDIPWRQIAGMRDFLAHVYFALDLEVLWNVVSVEVPKLASAVDEILGDERQSV